MNYRTKSGASSLKIDRVMLNLVFVGHFVFLWQFCFLVAIFFSKNMRRVNMNYHAKFGGSSLKND